MNRADAVDMTRKFWNEYTIGRPEYWEDQQPRMVAHPAFGDADDDIVVLCEIDSSASEDDPELLHLATRAMDALRVAHPELGAFPVTFELCVP